MEQAFDICQRIYGQNSLEAIYSPGLVRRGSVESDTENDEEQHHFLLRDTTDGITIMDLGDDKRIAVPIECKCRASPRTFAKERSRIETLHRENASGRGMGVSTEVDMDTYTVDMGTHTAYVVEMIVEYSDTHLELFHRCVPDDPK